MERVEDLGEFGVIDRLTRGLRSHPQVLTAIGDDAAVVRIGDRLQVVTSDLFIEGTHFRRQDAAPDAIGEKAAMGAMSDVAAMGGFPRFVVVSLAVSEGEEVAFLEGVYRGLSGAAAAYDAVIIGGDTTRSPAGLVIDVLVLGELRGNRYVLRSGARPGDWLVHTGRLGLAGAGLNALAHGRAAPSLVHRHYHPTARVAEGTWLCAQPHVHAMIDISDGLGQDAGHLADRSGLGVTLETEHFLVATNLRHYCEQHALDPAVFVLTGGEDYELLFAADPAYAPGLMNAFFEGFQLEATKVGEFTDAFEGVRVDGAPVTGMGFDHFRS
jgi:thiamine-monophosphate kinase